MASSRLNVLKPYDHLVDNLDHVVLDGRVSDLRKQDIVLDGMFWIKSLSDGRHDDQPAVTIQLAPLEAPLQSVGRLVMLSDLPIIFARPVQYETYDLQTTDEVPGVDYDESSAVLVSDLSPGDFVGWVEGDPRSDESPCRIRRVVKVYPNGLIQFEDGAYQSEPSHSWWVLNVDARALVKDRVLREYVDDAAHAFADGQYVGTDLGAPFIQWQDLHRGDAVRFETDQTAAAQRFFNEKRSDEWQAWCEARDITPFFVDRMIDDIQDFTTRPGYVIISFDDDLGEHYAKLTDYMTVAKLRDTGE